MLLELAPVKRLNDGTLHMELYTVEGYLTDLPPRTASAIWISIFVKTIILPMTVSPTNVSDSGNKSITWKDGSTSPLWSTENHYR